MALRPVHYLLVLFNDNQMHDLITATDSQGGNDSGGRGGRGGRAGFKVNQGHLVYFCLCVYSKKKNDSKMTEGRGYVNTTQLICVCVCVFE